jgi:acetolactate synthase-1/2/3 large subunit
MGFALPASVGAQIGNPDRQVVAVVGDGGIQMTIQELGTISQYKLPVKMIILNNHYLGMVRQWQELFFESRYASTELTNPDFVKISEGFGVPAKRISDRADLESSLKDLLAHEGPFVLEVEVQKEGNIFPMVPAGASVSEIRLD